MIENFKKYQTHLIYISLAIITFMAFEPVLHNSFISFDDDAYIYHNPNIISGLNKENIIWAFTNIHANNYHPLTSLSHMLDCQMYQLAPAGHHLTNLIFHIADTLLLFLVLSRMTKKTWASAFVAALFALHPLHVESVAWASERKDVLSTFFWMLTMLAYWRYAERPTAGRYLLTLVLFLLGLLSKPMMVTLPCVLLLLDYWPLNRFFNKKIRIGRLIAEKIPFFILSAIISLITLNVQGKMGVVKNLSNYPLPWRLGNAIVSYVIYIEKIFWPVNLAVFYPHPKGNIPLWQIAGAILILTAITVLAIWQIRKRPYIAVGWLWFLGTLVPVIGIFQVGMQAWANRYTYIPYIGIFIAITWWISDLTAKVRFRNIIFSVLAGVMFFAITVKTYFQALYWQNNITLYSHAINAVKNNWWAYSFLGTAWASQGEYDEALALLNKSMEIYPENATVYYELVKVYLHKGDMKQVIKMYEKLLPPLPEDLNEPRGVDSSSYDYPVLKNLYVNANINLATALTSEGRYKEAERRYKEAIRVAPDCEAAREGLKDLKQQMHKTSIKDANAN